MLPNIGALEIIVLLILAVIIFGPKLVRSVAKQAGKTRASAENAMTDMESAYQEEKARVKEPPAEQQAKEEGTWTPPVKV